MTVTHLNAAIFVRSGDSNFAGAYAKMLNNTQESIRKLTFLNSTADSAGGCRAIINLQNLRATLQLKQSRLQSQAERQQALRKAQ